MSLWSRPGYHHLRDSIEAHLTIVFAALAVSRWIEEQTAWSIRKFVRTARRYKIIEIQAGPHTVTPVTPATRRPPRCPRPHPQPFRCALSQLGSE
jgi:hypothetical protein